MSPIGTCAHEDFEGVITVNRLADIGHFHADVHVRCRSCGTRFAWVGVPAGLHLGGGAMVSPDRLVLNCRIEPAPHETSLIADDPDLRFPRATHVVDDELSDATGFR